MNYERVNMKVKELISLVFDDVIIYKGNNEEFQDIYKGSTKNIPENILEMNVESIGAKKKSVVDIRVFK